MLFQKLKEFKERRSFDQYLINNVGKNSRRALLLLAIIYVLAILYIWHVMHILTLDNYDLLSALSAGFVHIIIDPLIFFHLAPGSGTAFIAITIIFGVILLIITFKHNLLKHDDLDTISGDAKLMDKRELDEYNRNQTEPFGSPKASGLGNFIMSQDIYLSMNAQKTNVNLNILCIGGSGTGKSFRLVGPNILQRNCSMVITDPSGGLYKGYGSFLEYYGYKVKCFNLDHMEKSCHYNPFNYIHSDKDIEILVTMLIANTSSPNAKGDDFWEKCEIALLCALIAYLYHYQPKECQNFSTVKDLIRIGDIDENNSGQESPLDMIFKKIRIDHPDSFAITQYDTFRLGAGKTLKSILISCAVRLQAFDLEDVRLLTDTDNIDLDMIADERTAIFIIIPTGEKTFSFIAGLMYSQLFTQLYRYCENTAEYGYVFKDDTGDVIKTFRANSRAEKPQAEQNAQAFKDACQTAAVVENKAYEVVDGSKQYGFWEIRADKGEGEVLGFRGTKELAESALESMKNGVIQANSERGNDGQRCPIHVRFLLDEFANTGKIPDFTEKISTIRKYEISTTIILQSIKQIQNLYEKEWDVITANCDTLLYLGGGVDNETTKWLSEILGKKTVVSTSTSIGASGGSTNVQRTGIELFSQSKLRTMPREYCIVIPRTKNPSYGKMYDTPHHPNWKLRCSLPGYEFSEEKFIHINSCLTGGTSAKEKEEEKTKVQQETPEERGYRTEQNKQSEQHAIEVRMNLGADGEVKVGDVASVKENEMPPQADDSIRKIIKNEVPAEVSYDSMSVSDNLEMFEEMLCFNCDDGELTYSSQPMAGM